jgi:hypothetical protein
MISRHYNSQREFWSHAQKNFLLFIENFGWKKLLLIGGEKKKRSRQRLKPSKVFFKFELKKFYFIIQVMINLNLILLLD